MLTADAGGRALLSLCGPTGDTFHSVEVPLTRAAFPSHLHICSVAAHLPMFLVAPREVIVFQLRDLLEHAMDLLEQGFYDEAIRLADAGGDGIQGLRHIVCLKCVAPELKAANFDAACAIVNRFQDLEAATWQECIVLFDRYGALQHLAVNIPVPPSGARLPTEVYDEALARLVACPSALVAVLSWWPRDIFSAGTLAAKIQQSLGPDLDLSAERAEPLRAEDRCRVEALALLAAAEGNSEHAAGLLLGLNSPEVFRHLRSALSGDKQLAKLVEANARRLFEIDDRQACALMVDFHSTVSVAAVIGSLQGRDSRWRHEYLKQLFNKDEVAGHEYHMQMVELFAEYEPQGLLQFLRGSERYPLEEALEVCQRRGLMEEEAYLLGRAGRVGEALRVLLERVGDVGRAVEFASNYQDAKLWEFLVTFVLERPHLLAPLLDRLDALDGLIGEVDRDSGRPQPPENARPVHVLGRLPPGTPVTKIASSVTRVFRSVELTKSLQDSCSSLRKQEVQAGKLMTIAAHRKGALVAPASRRCAVCGRYLDRPPPLDDASSTSASASGAPESSAAPAAAAASSIEVAPLVMAPTQFRAPVRGGSSIVLQGQRAAHRRCHELSLAATAAAAAAGGSRGMPPAGSPREPGSGSAMRDRE